MSAHTPGPWALDGEHVIPATGYLGGVYVAQEGNGRVAEAFSNCLADAITCYANARLIAAAPELLEAMKGFFDEFGDFEYDALVIAKAKHAIYKAEGKQ